MKKKSDRTDKQKKKKSLTTGRSGEVFCVMFNINHITKLNERNLLHHHKEQRERERSKKRKSQ